MKKLISFIQNQITEVTKNQVTKIVEVNLRSLRGGYIGRNRYLTTTVYGHKIFVDCRDLILAPHIIIDGIWESWINHRVIASLKEGMRVVEIGSNIGYYTLLIAQHIGSKGKLIAFEANKDLAELTLDSLSINGYLDRVNLHSLAVSDSCGEMNFYIRERYLGNSSFEEVSEQHLDSLKDQQRKVIVKTVALDQFLQGADRQVDFLKIDVEGAEPRVFQGMKEILKENPHILIVMEYSPLQIQGNGSDPVMMMDFLYQLGFYSYRIEVDGGLTEITKQTLSLTENFDFFLTRSRL